MINPLTLLARCRNMLAGNRLADLSMRLARPILLMGFTAILAAGWFVPDQMAAYFTALSSMPEWLTDVFLIIILGLAVEKGVARPALEAVAVRAKAKADPTE